MEWSVRAAKRQEWSQRLQRFVEADVTVVEFCVEEQVSVASFYQWRRKLGTPVGSRATTRRVTAAAPRLDVPAFVPLQITSSATTVRMRLPNGVELWLPAGDVPSLTAAIEAPARIAETDGKEAAC